MMKPPSVPSLLPKPPKVANLLPKLPRPPTVARLQGPQGVGQGMWGTLGQKGVCKGTAF